MAADRQGRARRRADSDDFVFAWVHTGDDTPVHAVRVPRTLSGEIEAAPAKWAGLRDSVAEGMVVDLQREMFEE